VFVRVHILGRLHLNIIPASEVALVRTPVLILVVAALGILISVLWRRRLGVRVWLIRWRGTGGHPAGSVKWLASCLSSSSLRNTSADEEEEECGNEDDRQCYPSSPVAPRAATVIVSVGVAIVAPGHVDEFFEVALSLHDRESEGVKVVSGGQSCMLSVNGRARSYVRMKRTRPEITAIGVAITDCFRLSIERG